MTSLNSLSFIFGLLLHRQNSTQGWKPANVSIAWPLNRRYIFKACGSAVIRLFFFFSGRVNQQERSCPEFVATTSPSIPLFAFLYILFINLLLQLFLIFITNSEYIHYSYIWSKLQKSTMPAWDHPLSRNFEKMALECSKTQLFY